MKALYSICQQIWKTQQWPQDWKKSFFILIPKKRNAKECSNYCTIAFTSYTSTEKAMATHCSTLAWKIPWKEEPGRLQSMGVTKSWAWLSDFTFTFHFHALEKEMANHSSILAWRIPGTEEPGGVLSMGSHRVGHDWSDLATAVNICQRSIFKCGCLNSTKCFYCQHFS